MHSGKLSRLMREEEMAPHSGVAPLRSARTGPSKENLPWATNQLKPENIFGTMEGGMGLLEDEVA